MNDIQHSPYANLFTPENIKKLWQQAKNDFLRIAFKLFNKPILSPILLSFIASTLSLPILLKFYSLVSKESTAQIISTQEAVPSVEIDLGGSYAYHSTFVCPVNKSQATNTNPPVLLKCGHVISKDAMLKIAAANRLNRFKCPTCPREQTPADTITINF